MLNSRLWSYSGSWASRRTLYSRCTNITLGFKIKSDLHLRIVNLNSPSCQVGLGFLGAPLDPCHLSFLCLLSFPSLLDDQGFPTNAHHSHTQRHISVNSQIPLVQEVLLVQRDLDHLSHPGVNIYYMITFHEFEV